LESDNEKQQEIRQLEKQMHQKSSTELNCQNCLNNYQRFEEAQLKLKEALRKIEKLEAIEEPQLLADNDSEKMEALVKENKHLRLRVEQLDEKVKAGFVSSLENRQSQPNPEKDKIIAQLTNQIE
jgi:hypothetical protein